MGNPSSNRQALRAQPMPKAGLAKQFSSSRRFHEAGFYGMKVFVTDDRLNRTDGTFQCKKGDRRRRDGDGG